MRPETIVKGIVMLLFLLAAPLVQHSGVVTHLYAAKTAQELLPFVEGPHAYGHFDAHYYINSMNEIYDR